LRRWGVNDHGVVVISVWQFGQRVWDQVQPSWNMPNIEFVLRQADLAKLNLSKDHGHI
jgi:hypothetical protein